MRAMGRGSMVGMVMAAGVLVSVAAVVRPPAVAGRSAVEISVKDAELTPTEATAGDEIRVRSVGTGCVGGPGEWSRLVWAVFPHGDFVWGDHLGWKSGDALVSGIADPRTIGDTVGAWSTSFPAPDVDGAPPGGEIGPGSPVTSAVLQAYGPLPFTVDGHQLDFVAKCYEVPSATGTISISPEVPELGSSAVVTADDPCPMPHTQGGRVHLRLWEAAGTATPFPTIEVHDLSPVPVAEDGSWSATVDIPDEADHRFAVAGWCANAEGGATLGYGLTPFDVRPPTDDPTDDPADDPTGDPGETPPGFWDDVPVPPGAAPVAAVAAPAQAVLAQPSYTG